MLPLYYEIGRAAAFSAADAHLEQPGTDLLAPALMAAAYRVVISTDADEDGPLFTDARDTIQTTDAEWIEFDQGYRDGLQEVAIVIEQALDSRPRGN